MLCGVINPSFTLTVLYAVTANISHFYKCLSFLYGRIKHCLIQISRGGLLLKKKKFALIHWI